MRVNFSSYVFIFILLLSPFTITGNFQNVFALTPVADLTGEWSGFAQVSFTDTPCATSGKVNGYFTQKENNLHGEFSFIPTTPGAGDAEYCSYDPWEIVVDGTIDGSRITLFDHSGITFSGWYASSGIKLDLKADWLAGTTQLSPTGFTPQPVAPKDADGDGIPDSKDACPNESAAGTVDGCTKEETDSEGDKVPEEETDSEGDKVPEEETDSDGDKVPEEETDSDGDKVPEEETDSDGDGIPDYLDLCPTESAPGTLYGCPKQNIQEDQNTEEANFVELDNLLDAMKNEPEPKLQDWAEGVPIEGDTPELFSSQTTDTGIPILQNQKVGNLHVNKGSVTVTTADGKVVNSNELKIGQTIQTGQNADTNVQIEIGDGATMSLKEKTRISAVGIISTDGKNLSIINDDIDQELMDKIVSEQLADPRQGLDKPLDKETFGYLATGAVVGGFVVGFFPALTALAFGTAAIGTAALVGYTLYEGSVHFETTPSKDSDGKNHSNVIFTGNGAFLDKETEFTVTVEDGATKLNVLDGEVYFVPYDNSPPTLITAGNSFSISDEKTEKTSLDTNSVDKWWEVSAEQESKSGGGCLIATATFGSELAPQVQFLREIRDKTVLSTESGASFMTAFNAFYYSFSPTIADLERQNPAFKETVKVAITPLLSSLSLLQYVDIDSESEMLGYGVGIILLNIGMYFVAPSIIIIKLRSLFKK